jgi:hypothetical protein
MKQNWHEEYDAPNVGFVRLGFRLEEAVQFA